MTDAVLSTQPANTVAPPYTFPGSQVPNVIPPPQVTPIANSNVSGPSLLVLASTGAFKLSTPLNTGGQSGPATALAGMGTGFIVGSNVP